MIYPLNMSKIFTSVSNIFTVIRPSESTKSKQKQIKIIKVRGLIEKPHTQKTNKQITT